MKNSKVCLFAQKQLSLGNLRFHRASTQQEAGTHTSGMAPEVPSTTPAAQNIRSSAEILSESGLGGLFVGTRVTWGYKKRPLVKKRVC